MRPRKSPQATRTRIGTEPLFFFFRPAGGIIGADATNTSTNIYLFRQSSIFKAVVGISARAESDGRWKMEGRVPDSFPWSARGGGGRDRGAS